jgi:hypothetical protein
MKTTMRKSGFTMDTAADVQRELMNARVWADISGRESDTAEMLARALFAAGASQVLLEVLS